MARATVKEITILCAHDCDAYGFEIFRTLEEETRTTQGVVVKAIDLGLFVKDALEMGLEPEELSSEAKLSQALSDSKHLTKQDKEFLTYNRIELNAMSTSQLIPWFERKLAELGLVKKLIPPDDVLSEYISNKLRMDFDDHADAVIKATFEKLLKINFYKLNEELTTEIKFPETTGHRDDLVTYMKNLPPSSWRDWAETRRGKISD